ncbi:MAG: DUF2254 domain-containing protein [Chloroflexota bacterium]|nr:DUF2254 domain-containing protein [Chloroflexota bacterium]
MNGNANQETSLLQRLRDAIPTRLQSWWDRTKSSLWFLPTIGVVLATFLAVLFVYLDRQYADQLEQTSLTSPWLFGVAADGARGVLTAIAGSVITVVGTVFSITIVALQLASSQFTPRVLRQFTGDRINQLVLAIFIGTFTYCLLVLRTIRAETDSEPGFIPYLSVTFSILLALVAVMMLILFIHHMARQMQVAYILHRAMGDAVAVIDSYFREEIDIVPQTPHRNYAEVEGHDFCSDSTGYLQHYDYAHLLGAARDHNLTIRMLEPMGSYVNSGQPIARIWLHQGEDGKQADLDNAIEALRKAIVTGSQRTMTSDLPLGVRQISDIAIKALSPGINDPTTATQALDRLSEVLAHAGQMEVPVRILYVDDRPAVFLPRIAFEELTYIAFTQVRHYGKADLVVMLHLVQTIERIAALVTEKHQEVLHRHLELARASGEQGLALGPDRELFLRTVDASLERLRRRRNGERVPITPDIMQVG